MDFELVPDGQAMSSNLYNEQVGRVYTVLNGEYPTEKIIGTARVHIVPHPVYSPDIT